MPITYLEVKDRNEAQAVVKELGAVEWQVVIKNGKHFLIARFDLPLKEEVV